MNRRRPGHLIADSAPQLSNSGTYCGIQPADEWGIH